MNPVDLFSHETNPVKLAPGETLFKADDAADGMFVLQDGTIKIVGGDKVVETSARGSIVSEMALVDHSPRSATVVAHPPASLAKVDERRFQRII